ncbi:MAG TPA: HD domain-containing protein [Candidatus Peribacteraceae bacterium]|nr:HD domain-containing protein [Candidatus Peribacteraceae bacterium]
MTLFSAIRLAAKAHRGQMRLDGTPYIEHPLAVLELLWEISLDLPPNVYTTAILHDVLEDTDVTYEELHECAGSDIAAVVRVLTKDNLYYNLPTVRREKMYLDRIRAANAIYPYTLLIKLVDRLHNIRTADVLSEERKWKLLRETRGLYLPLAERLLGDLPHNLRPIYLRCMDQLNDALDAHRLPPAGASKQKNFARKIFVPIPA